MFLIQVNSIVYCVGQPKLSVKNMFETITCLRCKI